MGAHADAQYLLHHPQDVVLNMIRTVRRQRQRGVSLIEMMVTLVILGVLMATGVPMFTMWIQNTQIRTAAEAIMNGLQAAKNEAIRSNRAVHLEFTTGTGYIINPKSDPDQVPPIRTRSHDEGSYNAVATTTPGGGTVITFSALGRIDPNNHNGSPVITQIDIDNPSMPAAESRELRIIIPAGGAIRMCDPQAPAGDPRAC